VSTAAPAFGRFTGNGEQGAAALRAISSRLKLDRVFNGGWFRKLAIDHIRRHAEKVNAAYWDRTYPGLTVEQRADALIRKVCAKAATAGALASTGASTGELMSLFTEGMGAPIGMPAAALSMAAEAAYTAFLQIDLACDLGSLYGVHFDVDDVADLTTLFGLALELPPPAKKEPATFEDQAAHAPGGHGGAGAAEAEPHGLIGRLIELEDGEVARRIGRKLLEESVLRNIIPVLGIAISARWNFVATRRLAGTVRRYVRYRRALRDSLTHLRLDELAAPELVAEGAWLLASIEGPPPSETAMAVGVVVDMLPERARAAIQKDQAFGDDDEQWFEDLKGTPATMHAPLLDVLYLVAAANRELQPTERRFLHRVGHVLAIPIDLGRVEQICRHLASGEPLPGAPTATPSQPQAPSPNGHNHHPHD
jgi:hypothetical protein